MAAKQEKAGYLLKRGELNKAWKARWCKVDGPNLLYYKKVDNARPVGFIPLEQAVIRVGNRAGEPALVSFLGSEM